MSSDDFFILNNKFHLLLELLPCPVFIKDTKGRYSDCNKKFCDYLGIPFETIIGATVYDIAPKALADIYYQKDQELFWHPGLQEYKAAVNYSDGTSHQVVFTKKHSLQKMGWWQG
jgi:PAS domain-containing protein